MINEYVFLILTFLDLAFILFCFRFGKNLLYIALVLNLLLISAFGAKLITIFGTTTNIGNSFFACVFLATYLITEHWGRREAIHTIWIGLVSLVFYLLMAQLVLTFHGSSATLPINQALEIIYRFQTRVATASIISYVIVQVINIWVFDYLHTLWRRKKLWARTLVATLVGQGIDSVLFFSLAFVGVVPPNILVQTMLAGFIIKVGVGIVAIPLLYISYILKPDELRGLHSDAAKTPPLP